MANPAVENDSFSRKIAQSLPGGLLRNRAEILQVNLGKLCNLSCSHCHVEAGPTRTAENMNSRIASDVIRLMQWPGWTTLDLTGGAPEMNPYFRDLVLEARKHNLKIIDRCNLTILSEPSFEWLAGFLSENEVEVVASLPCYSRSNVDEQRGSGTFEGSINALKELNSLGYGSGGKLKLHLVYNPVGPHLPPEQKNLETDYKKRLAEDFGITFDSLYTITNMPIKRYRKYLTAKGDLESYEALLAGAYNSGTLDSLMCRNTLSVSWDGSVYDCDFNQMLGMEIERGSGYDISALNPDDLTGLKIRTADHCFGCTAGAGSSCQGSLS